MLRLGEAIERTGSIPPEKLAETARFVAKLARDARMRGVEPARGARHEPGPAGRERRGAARTARCRGAVRRCGCSRPRRRAGWRSSGALAAARVGSKRLIAVCDVGGGSAQVAVGTRREGPVWVRSLDIGSMRLTSRMLDDDPPGDAAVARARARGRGDARRLPAARAPDGARRRRQRPGAALDRRQRARRRRARRGRRDPGPHPAREIVELYGIEPEPGAHARRRRRHPRRDPRAPARAASGRARRRPRGRRARARRERRADREPSTANAAAARRSTSLIAAGRPRAPCLRRRALELDDPPGGERASSTASARTRCSATTASWCAPIRSWTSAERVGERR